MPTPRNPIQVIKEAKQIAADHGCFVAERGGRFHLYRRTGAHTPPAWCGSAALPASLLLLVKRVTNFR